MFTHRYASVATAFGLLLALMPASPLPGEDLGSPAGGDQQSALPSQIGAEKPSDGPALTAVFDAFIRNADRLGAVQAVVTVDLTAGAPSIFNVDHKSAKGSYLIVFDPIQFRMLITGNE